MSVCILTKAEATKRLPESQRLPIAAVIDKDKDKPKRFLYVEYDEDAKPQDEVRELMAEPGTSFEYLPMIPENQRYACYISGISGSGKSSAAREIIGKLRKQSRFKQLPVWFITIKDGDLDPAFEGLKDFRHLDVHDPEFIEISYEEYENSVVVFDDWSQLDQKSPLAVYLNQLVKKLLELARKINCQIIIINHMTQQMNKTRETIFECTDYCLFPRSNMNSTLRFIKAYVSEDKQLLEKIKNIRGSQFTQLMIRKTAPSYLMTPKWVQLF
jgi:hypothetical protein